ncbi:MAG TPA: DNA-directed RNA polymerase subunit omega [Bacillota bacterium]|nr:DNA-directed RNA polymerase subunit omega [Candidatus Fermentithermobacillaceae bacterium]HOB30101.1 DNA-directed RNA polymerase subunit omega [Bacillota bacterium]HOK63991.1 DNA-directed RNA polymerase subunit omega [Bacillota bacterium]HOL11346.1 DNA-directed RNA polymerase subunit omega [Bacillota bacterium]HOQ02475.1 DNA-directed RNA polymerase subunit omega [Bacillota bacterium]
MTTPTLRDLIEKTGSKYLLVVGVAKRAREIIDMKEHKLLEVKKPVTIAIEEIAKGDVVIKYVPRESVT